ncbi:MAG TPA: hypothetical protein VIG99_23580 [Myxococcaceae bacterium]|jgi:hypothetical protein
MQGVITLRDVVAHAPTIVREFGSKCLLRCLVVACTRQKTTFLEVAFRSIQ